MESATLVLFLYDTYLIENDAFILCIHCSGNVFTESWPSNDKGLFGAKEKHAETRAPW
jgi:hypothetical protein